ncbi:hypothetical protein Fcan01_18944 [Folsomia candida]|uniref:Uncharacterized protein n=1 Tax=Folsomia candida TaxID=158441 RepID=A0A226DL55_FOLCA|nr:hypothetical protein Fcan01_18944 [Folsomia candida]
MANPEPEISEFFGAFLVYSEIMEKSFLFGKFPFHWDPIKGRLLLDFHFSRDYKSLVKTGIFLVTTLFPGIVVFLRSLHNKLQLSPHFEDYFASDGVMIAYLVMLVVLLGDFALFMVVILFWKSYTEGEIERSFCMFRQLSKVRPKQENGVHISTRLIKFAKLVVHFYAQLPLTFTLFCIPFNLDPMYYSMFEMQLDPNNLTNMLVRTVLFVVSCVEVCRLIALLICLVLFAINLGQRETFMWTNIAKRSNLGGLYFYRQIAILYTFRRGPTTIMLSLTMIVGFVTEFLFKSGVRRLEILTSKTHRVIK